MPQLDLPTATDLEMKVTRVKEGRVKLWLKFKVDVVTPRYAKNVAHLDVRINDQVCYSMPAKFWPPLEKDIEGFVFEWEADSPGGRYDTVVEVVDSSGNRTISQEITVYVTP